MVGIVCKGEYGAKQVKFLTSLAEKRAGKSVGVCVCCARALRVACQLRRGWLIGDPGRTIGSKGLREYARLLIGGDCARHARPGIHFVGPSEHLSMAGLVTPSSHTRRYEQTGQTVKGRSLTALRTPLAIGVVVAVAAFLYGGQFAGDDTYIYMRYVGNLLAGNGFS